MSEEKIKMCYYNKTEPCLVFNISGLPMTQIEICNTCKKKRKLSFDEIVNGMDEAITSLKKNNYQCELRQLQAENKRLREALEKTIDRECDNTCAIIAKQALGE